MGGGVGGIESGGEVTVRSSEACSGEAGVRPRTIVIIATGPHMSWMNWTCQNQTYMATNDPNLSKIIIVLDFVIVINGTEMNPTSPRYQKISSKDGKYTELANKLQFLLSFISGT